MNVREFPVSSALTVLMHKIYRWLLFKKSLDHGYYFPTENSHAILCGLKAQTVIPVNLSTIISHQSIPFQKGYLVLL